MSLQFLLPFKVISPVLASTASTSVLLKNETRALVRQKARSMARKCHLSRSDRDDLEQELYLHLCQQASRFDARRGTWRAFAQTAISRKAISILRQRFAACRDCRRVVSLSREIGRRDGRPLELAGRLLHSAHQKRLRLRSMGEHAYTCLWRDLHEVAAELPDRTRQVAAELQRDPCVARVARRLGLSRDTVYQELQVLRDAMHEAGLHHYLADDGDTFLRGGVVSQ